MNWARKETILWVVFGFYILSIISAGLFWQERIRIDLSQYPVFNAITLGTPLLLLALHSLWTLTFLRALLFISLGLLFGFLTEYIGLNYGVIFGGTYHYNLSGIAISGVPLFVMLYWSAFTYTGYSLVNSFLYWRKKEKPQKKHNDWWRLPSLIVFDGSVVTSIDLLMEPLQVLYGNWSWPQGGPYFGVPIGNFIGWFIVAVIITTIFRLIEYFYPVDTQINKRVFIMPVIGYGVLCLSLVYHARQNNLTSLVVIGCVILLGFVVTNLFLFSYRRKHLSTS